MQHFVCAVYYQHLLPEDSAECVVICVNDVDALLRVCIHHRYSYQPTLRAAEPQQSCELSLLHTNWCHCISMR